MQPINRGVVLLGVAIDSKPLNELVETSMAAIRGGGAAVRFACANPHSLVVAQQDTLFLAALDHSAPVVADGVGVALAANLAGEGLIHRVTGWDYFLAVMCRLDAAGGGRVFFLGSTPQVLERIADRMARDFPNLTLCGLCSPPFGAWSESVDGRILEQIRAARPDVLWVGMTAPKQEKWVDRHRRALAVPLVGCIGAVFDFYAGTCPRAPGWMCRAGLEWVYRLVREPRRLWRRNFISTPVFLVMVLWRHVLGLPPWWRLGGIGKGHRHG